MEFNSRLESINIMTVEQRIAVVVREFGIDRGDVVKFGLNETPNGCHLQGY